MGENGGLVVFPVLPHTRQSPWQPLGQRKIDGLIKIKLQRVSFFVPSA